MDISRNLMDGLKSEPSDNNTLMCFSLACSNKPQHIIDRVKYSNKIFLPESMLFQYKQEKFPLYFKLTHPSYGVSCVVGVEEFTGPPGCFNVPLRIMDHLLITEGENINVQICHPLKGTHLKLKPRKTAFIELLDPKAILEKFLSKDYPVISLGETICINYLDTLYHIDVVGCEPGNSIDILNTDVNLDFEAPADYVEPEKKVAAEPAAVPAAEPAAEPVAHVPCNMKLASSPIVKKSALKKFQTNCDLGFVPFSGSGNRLGDN